MAKRETKNRETVEKRRDKVQQPQQIQSSETVCEQSIPGIAEKILNLQQTCGNRYVQRLAEGNGSTLLNKDVTRRIENQKGSGASLDHERRSEMEVAFRQDFSQVRIHADAEADSLSRDLKAKAFTTGKDIFFRANSYEPASENGRKLLSHELTHVVQQQDTISNENLQVGPADDQCEKEADAVAGQVMQGQAVGVQSQTSTPAVQREVITEEEPMVVSTEAGGEANPRLDASLARLETAFRVVVPTSSTSILVRMAVQRNNKLTSPTRPVGPLERAAIAQTLILIYDTLDARIRHAPIGDDGLPDIEGLDWDSSDPLAGTLEAIEPFGSYDTWVSTLEEAATEAPTPAGRGRTTEVEMEEETVTGRPPTEITMEEETITGRPPTEVTFEDDEVVTGRITELNVEEDEVITSPPVAEVNVEEDEVVTGRPRPRRGSRPRRVQVEQTGPTPTPTPTETEEPTYSFDFGGRQYSGPRSELPRQLGRLITMVRNRCLAGEESLEYFLDEIHTPVIADICDFFGGVRPPERNLFDLPLQTCEVARLCIESGDYQQCLQILQRALTQYNERHRRFYNYREGTVRGGERTVEGLEVTSATLITIGATGLTAGLAPGAGLLASSAITGGFSVGGTALAELGRETSERAQGIDTEFNWERFLTNTLVSGATNFISSLTAGALRPTFTRLLANRLLRMTPQLSSAIIARGGAPPLGIAFRAWLETSIPRLVAQLPASALSSTLSTTVEALQQRRPPQSIDEFLRIYTGNLTQESFGNIVAELVVILAGR